MPIGHSGRLVIEVDPDFKQELYASLEKDGLTLKEWFVARAKEYLRDRGQLSLDLTVADGDSKDSKDRKYG